MSCCGKNQRDVIETLEKRKKDYMALESKEKLTWCSGCGNYGIQKAIERALVLEDIKQQDLVMCFDIGCNGNGSDKINTTTFHGLHGRIISAAAGAAIANTKMQVLAEAGDGATFSEGPNHLIHGVRNNYPMTFIFHNNENYGLTTGQASAMTRMGQKMNATPDGVVVKPMNACKFVLSLEPTFVARTFSGDIDHMTEIFRLAMNHKGFAFVEVFQMCPTYNKHTTQTWFEERIIDLSTMKGYDKHNIKHAMEAAEDIEKEIKVGILYEDKKSVPYQELLESRKTKKTELVDEVKHVDITKFINKQK